MRRSWPARRDAAVDARNDAESAVALDVRVHAVIDEPRVALVFVLGGPECLQERRQPDLAFRVLPSVGERREHRGHAAQVAGANRLDERRLVSGTLGT